MIPSSPVQTSSPRRGFSLIEILVVVAVLTILVAITLTVGSSMLDAGKKNATEGVLRLLDQSLADYIDTTGSIPPALVKIESGSLNTEVRGIVGADNPAFYPAVDGRIDVVIPNDDPTAPVRHYEINSVGLYLYSIRSALDPQSIVSHLDSKLARNYDLQDDLQPELLTVFDAWGNPIRYVHPTFDGIIENNRRAAGEAGDFLAVFDTDPNTGTGFFTRAFLPVDLVTIPFINAEGDQIIRRNKILTYDQEFAYDDGSLDYPVETDSDGGVCPNQRPYFYSAGPDGDPSTVEDNIYTVLPEFLSPL